MSKEMQMLHWTDNTYFGRLPDGTVRVVKFSRSPFVQWWHNERASTVPTEHPRADGEFQSVEVLLDVRIPPNEWASIVASVSKGGESDGRYYEAEKFHQGAATVAEVEPNYKKLFQDWVSLQSGDVQKMIADAMRYQAVKGCDWIGLRVDGQEFIGVSNLDAWADVRLDGPHSGGKDG